MTQEEKINVAELLKDCPKGMELNCTMWDNVVFDHIDTKSDYPIYIKKMSGELECLTEDGCFNFNLGAKCVIYPKGKTTWEGFVPPYKFKDGDILFVKSTYDWLLIYKESGNDVDLYKYVSIPHNCSYNFITYDSNPICRKKEVSEIRLATEEEKQKLFKAIKDNGYKWNPKNKTLEKLPKFKAGDRIVKKDGFRVTFLITGVSDVYYLSNTENSVEVLPVADQDGWELVPTKFDVTTLLPFDKVLVRDTNEDYWKINMFGYIGSYDRQYFMCIANSGFYQCIPYEGNQHLLGTTNDCDEYYKTWEK